MSGVFGSFETRKGSQTAESLHEAMVAVPRRM